MSPIGIAWGGCLRVLPAAHAINKVLQYFLGGGGSAVPSDFVHASSDKSHRRIDFAGENGGLDATEGKF
jgi:hypothetical protein